MILSVSRRTDIPAFYSEWFVKRLKEGFGYLRNPINRKMVSKITLSPDLIEFVMSFYYLGVAFNFTIYHIQNFKI